MKKKQVGRNCNGNPLIKILRIMKLTVFLFFLGFVQALAGNLLAQTTKLSLDAKNSRIESVLQDIEKQSDFRFIYNKEKVDVDSHVNVQLQDKSVKEVLDILFQGKNVNYTFFGNNIVLSNAGTATVQQQISVSGRVTDSFGQPLPGVTVIIKGTTTGIITDNNGRYSLSNVSSDATLVFSFVGMRTQEISVGGRTIINVTLAEESVGIGEVVAVGYGTQKKVNLSGAVAAVSGDVLENRPITNVGQGLQGVIPNLQITQSSYAPGEGASFNIRGTTSLNGGSPLILIDGVEQDPNLINPDDIESISVLKDAASAAIYGARASYGVILISTKKGEREQAPKLNVSSSYTVTSATNIPEYADSWEYITYMNTASINAGGSNYFDQRLMNYALKYYEDPKNNLPVYYDPEIDTDGKYNYCGNTNWAKELYKNGTVKQANASLSGGSQKSRYYISYGFMQQNGFLESYDDRYMRHNVNMFVETDVSKWLSLSSRIKYNYTNEDHPSGGSNGWSGLSTYSGQLKNDLSPLMPIKHPDGNWAGQGNITNPFAVGAEGGYDKRKINDIWLTGAIDIHPLEGLSLKADYTYNPYSWNKERTSRLFYEHWAEKGKYNIYPWVNPNSVALENSNDYYQSLNFYVDYVKKINSHNFKLLVGYNQEKKATKWMYAKRENLIDNDLPAINRATGEDYVDGSSSSWATQGIFTRFNYDYKGKYLFEFNGRYDGSSKFPDGDRFEFFPSFSTGWRLSEETFWSALKEVVNEAKVRGSYGSLGNQNLSDDFPYVSAYNVNTSTSYIIGGELPVSVTPGALVSPSFTWEEVKQWNAGLDLDFFNSKLATNIDIYQRKTIGMLTAGQTLPAVLGTDVPDENAADLKTTGWEFVVTWKNKINDFFYNVSFNISDYQSKITKFSNPTGYLDSYYVGRKINEIWGLEATGLFQSTEEIANHSDQSVIYGGTWNAGDVKYVDRNNDNKITYGDYTLDNHGDYKIIGNSTPRYQFGLRMHAEWKGFDMNIFFQGVGKRDLWTGDRRFFGIDRQWDVPMKETLDYWTEDNRDARLPRPYIDGGHGNRWTSTLYLQDASYIRLKQLTVGYTLPERLTKKAAISKARFYVTGQNLLTFTKLNDLYDPENTNLMGYPVPKSFSCGLNITF